MINISNKCNDFLCLEIKLRFLYLYSMKNKLCPILLFFILSFNCLSQKINEIKIGNQIWATDNLNVEKFRNGDIIKQAKTIDEWMQANENEQPAWCYYENKEKNGIKFGKLYNGFAVFDPRVLAPEGYHIPTDEEWTTLIQFVNEEKSKNKLNELKFNMQYGGFRYDGGNFNGMKESGYWWSKTEYFETKNGWFRSVDFKSDSITRDMHGFDWGFYVRCIKD